MKHECIGRPDRFLKSLADFNDGTIEWILNTHADDEWLTKEHPEDKPVLRRYMRLAKQEAHKRGLLGS